MSNQQKPPDLNNIRELGKHGAYLYSDACKSRDKNKFFEAAKYLKIAADKGDAPAQYFYGTSECTKKVGL